MKRIYLDNAATTFLAPEVIEEMSLVLKEYQGNPSSVHSYGREARVLLEEKRRTVAELIKAQPAEIVFTSSATEAINTVVFSAVRNLKIASIITSELEHHAVLHAIETHASALPCHFVKHNTKGVIDLNHLEELLKSNPGALVMLMHANNEIGNLLSIKECGKLCERYGALFFCDMVQTFGKYICEPGAMGVHFASCSAHKFHGPKGIGFLYRRSDVQLQPMIVGGGQERTLRSGTENLPGIAGLAKALELSVVNNDAYLKKLYQLKNYMAELLEQNFPDLTFNGTCRDGGLCNLLNCSFGGNSEMLIEKLDMMGVCVSGGSACNSGALKRSHVLEALGADKTKTPVRFSFSRYNSEEEIDKTIEILKQILKK